jgi:tRNA-splicing ligase RtcB
MLKKISENIWEIEKEEGMNVPGIVLASDKLMESIKQDKTLEQVKNVAKLPGIIEKSIALSDAHQGYGFPIGGVAAFDMKKGIISPGGVGYDINCLTGDSKILTEFGSLIKIEDFGKNQSEVEVNQGNQKIKKVLFNLSLPTLNLTTKNAENKEIHLFMARDSEDVYKIKLNSGLTIKATGDHPFLTKEGMIQLSKLSKEELAINLFEGIECNDKINKKEVILAKIIGFMLGDGCFYQSGKDIYACAYGSKEDLETIKADLESINVNSKIYSRKRDHKITTKYGTKKFTTTNHELYIHSKEFKDLLKERGMPLGNKTRQKIRVPAWIKSSNKLIKRLFLAGFFGAELSSPSTSSKTCFFCPTIDHNKIESLSQNARDFLIEIVLMLEEFGIKATKITEMDDHKNRYGEKTKRFRLFIKGEGDMLKIWRNIGFEYNKKRQNLANIASLYILLKKQENMRRVKLSQKIKEYKKKGLTFKEVKGIFLSKINERFIERHYYESAGQRISLDFISFKEFRKKKLEEIKQFGAIFDKISEIKKLEGIFKVYDFNIKDNHNFIANGFIVSNCGVRVGRGSQLALTDEELTAILNKGASWAMSKGYDGGKEDIEKTEDSGFIKGADSSKVSQRAKARGRKQLGTLGAGNHFLEMQEVEKIYDKKIAKIFGIEKEGQVTVMIHCGSRGLGHQVASDYIKAMEKEYGWEHLPDRELASAPINSKLGKDYFSAMAAAANFAFTNRHVIMHHVRKAFKNFFPKSWQSLKTTSSTERNKLSVCIEKEPPVHSDQEEKKFLLYTEKWAALSSSQEAWEQLHMFLSELKKQKKFLLALLLTVQEG